MKKKSAEDCWGGGWGWTTGDCTATISVSLVKPLAWLVSMEIGCPGLNEEMSFLSRERPGVCSDFQPCEILTRLGTVQRLHSPGLCITSRHRDSIRRDFFSKEEEDKNKTKEREGSWYFVKIQRPLLEWGEGEKKAQRQGFSEYLFDDSHVAEQSRLTVSCADWSVKHAINQ